MTMFVLLTNFHDLELYKQTCLSTIFACIDLSPLAVKWFIYVSSKSETYLSIDQICYVGCRRAVAEG